MKDLEKETYITRPEALAILGVSQVTLDKYVRDGRLAKFGGGRGHPARYRLGDCKHLKAEIEKAAISPTT